MDMELENNSLRKIKILRIIARLNIGGPAIHAILLTGGLDKSRFSSLLVTGTVEKNEGDMLYLADDKDIRPIIIPELTRSLNIRNDIIAFWKLFCLIKKERPDIIHTHTAKAGALGRLAGLLYKFSLHLSIDEFRPLKKRTKNRFKNASTIYNMKLIHTFHGHVLHSYFSRIKSVIFIWIERLLALFTHKIITVSESVRKELIQLRIASPKKIVTIPLGLELEKYLRIENDSPRPNDYKTVGIIGRLVPVKNHKMFLDSAKRLRDMLGFEQKIKFFIVGDGPLYQELSSYAEKLGIKDDVNFTSWIKDLKDTYSELDIVVLTSLNEGTPVALIEAMAAGKPVISSDVGGVKDLFSKSLEEGRGRDTSTIRHYDQGVLVNSGDVISLSTAIKNLLETDETRKKMGEIGRKTVYPKYDISRLADDIKSLYLNLTGEYK